MKGWGAHAGERGDGEAGFFEELLGAGIEEGQVVHDEGWRDEGVADVHGGVEALGEPVRGARLRGRVRGDEDEAAAGAERAVDAGDERGLVALEDVTEGAERDGEVDLGVEGHVEGVAAHEPERGVAGRVAHASLGLREHAFAPIDPDDLVGAERAEPAHRGARAAAHVERTRDGARRPDRGRDGFEDRVRCAERRVVELRREQVVAAIGRGERLLGELEQRGAFRMEH